MSSEYIDIKWVSQDYLTRFWFQTSFLISASLILLYITLYSVNFWLLHINEIIQHLSFSVWLISLQSVQLVSHVWLFATLWTAAHQASLSITSSWSLLKLISIESLMPSNCLILCCPLLLLPSVFPSSRVFSREWVLHIRWPKIGASASVLPMNIQDWFPLGLTGLISLQSKGLWRVFPDTTVQKNQFFGAQLSL